MTNQQFYKPPFKKSGSFQDRRDRGSGKNFIRKNDRIRAREVRVIDSDGHQLGLMSTSEAILIAKRQNLDLVEISPNANPPVCKILDFGKYKYEESKKSKGNAKPISSKTKEVKLRVAIESNDYNTKLRHAIEFLDSGFKLKLTLMFRGRELAHTNLGFDLVKKFANDIQAYGSLDSEPKLCGKMISVILSPCAKKQNKSATNPSSSAQTIGKILDASELLKLK